MTDPQINLNYETQFVTVANSDPTVSVIWDRQVQQAVINDISGPTIASRAYGILHTAMYDAWSAYADTPISTNLGDDLQRPSAENTDANKSEAMSYAAYYVLVDLFPEQQQMFARQMADLGYDISTISTDNSDPAGIGYISAQALLDVRRQDGSNQTGNLGGDRFLPQSLREAKLPQSSQDDDLSLRLCGETPKTALRRYSDYTGYQPANQPGDIEFIELWTPDVVPLGNGEFRTQEFLTPQWGNVTPFALESGSQFRPTAPQPFLLVEGTVDLDAKTITLSDGRVLEISRDLVGTIINPEFIAQAETVVEYSRDLTDKQKLIAEFWEDGAGTSFPPGTFMTFGQYVSERDRHTLDDDAQMFFALGNAELDAGIAAWDAKVAYDYARPVSVVRELGELGLIGEYSNELGGYAIEAFSGYGEGTQTILASDFITYQTPESDLSPPFAEYVSGHSTFSTAGAEVLKQFTGSDEFGASVFFPPGTSRFETGLTPQNNITLTWDTFSDAADESGISRLYGGIHFVEGDLNGRALGREVGNAVYQQAQFYINGGDGSGDGTPSEGAILATDGADNLSGGKEDDRLDGLAGDDRIDGDKGNDELKGDEGQDLIYGDKDNDTLLGGEGNDSLDGGKDNDYLDGGAGNDLIYGDKGDDTLLGGEGNDSLDGGKDDDYLNGNVGNDLIYGDKGDDTLLGGEGDDYLCGGKGDDFVDGGAGVDDLCGDKGKDTFILRIGGGGDRILDFDNGKDRFFLTDGLSYDRLEFNDTQTGTQITIDRASEIIATVQNIPAYLLDAADFVSN